MKKTKLTGGAGTMYLSVAGHDDPVEIALDEVSVVLHDDITEIRNDFLRQPTQIKIGDRRATIRARFSAIVDGQPIWELFGFQTETGTIARKRKQEILTIPESSPYEVELSPDSGYGVDWNALVVVDYDGDTPSGNQYDRVGGSPSAGEYKVDENAGSLIFSSADAGRTILVRYLETKSGIYYAYGNALRRCVRIEAAFPVLSEFGCPGEMTDYITIIAPRAVPTADYTIIGSREAQTIEMEFVVLADPSGTTILLGSSS